MRAVGNDQSMSGMAKFDAFSGSAKMVSRFRDVREKRLWSGGSLSRCFQILNLLRPKRMLIMPVPTSASVPGSGAVVAVMVWA